MPHQFWVDRGGTFTDVVAKCPDGGLRTHKLLSENPEHYRGDGTVRRVRFLEPMTVAILSGHRRVAPYGMDGGEPGATGRNYVVRAVGRVDELGPTASTEVATGDVFVVETPGGGGYGTPPP